MENFEEELHESLTNESRTKSTTFIFSQKDSLEVLLEHVYRKVLVPTHYFLTEQEQFSKSTLATPQQSDFGDTVDDGMNDRPMAVFTVIRFKEPLFEYWLSFNGENSTEEESIWRKVDVIRGPAFDLNNPPADFFDLDSTKIYLGKTTLDEKAVNSLNEYECFHTLDLDEAVRLVQKDLNEVCETLL